MRGVAVAMAIAVGLGGCTSDGVDSAADPTVPTSASTSSTPAVPDVSVIPEVIDEPYLNAVLAALDEVDGQAARIIVATKRFPPEAADLLNSIYSDQRFQVQADAWFDALGSDPELKAIKPNPGNRRTTVHRIIASSKDCVAMSVNRDHSANSTSPTPPRREYLALKPLDRSNDPNQHNPTGWMISADGFNADGSEPGDLCVDAS